MITKFYVVVIVYLAMKMISIVMKN